MLGMADGCIDGSVDGNVLGCVEGLDEGISLTRLAANCGQSIGSGSPISTCVNTKQQIQQEATSTTPEM